MLIAPADAVDTVLVLVVVHLARRGLPVVAILLSTWCLAHCELRANFGLPSKYKPSLDKPEDWERHTHSLVCFATWARLFFTAYVL